MISIGFRTGEFQSLVIDSLPSGCLLLHAVCNHVPLRVPFLETADHDQIRCILRQPSRFFLSRFHGGKVCVCAIGGHVPLVTPLISAVIQGWGKKITNNLGDLFKAGEPLLAFIHAVFDHVKLASPFFRAFGLDVRGFVNRLPDFCRDRERQNKNGQGGKSQGENGHRSISFEYHWHVTKCAGNRGGRQAPVVCDNTAGSGFAAHASADRGQARLHMVAPYTSLLRTLRAAAGVAARLFPGVCHG